jgi:hypothetical protein
VFSGLNKWSYIVIVLVAGSSGRLPTNGTPEQIALGKKWVETWKLLAGNDWMKHLTDADIAEVENAVYELEKLQDSLPTDISKKARLPNLASQLTQIS